MASHNTVSQWHTFCRPNALSPKTYSPCKYTAPGVKTTQDFCHKRLNFLLLPPAFGTDHLAQLPRFYVPRWAKTMSSHYRKPKTVLSRPLCRQLFVTVFFCPIKTSTVVLITGIQSGRYTDNMPRFKDTAWTVIYEMLKMNSFVVNGYATNSEMFFLNKADISRADIEINATCIIIIVVVIIITYYHCCYIPILFWTFKQKLKEVYPIDLENLIF